VMILDHEHLLLHLLQLQWALPRQQRSLPWRLDY
jgi:hypothetical protein